MPKYRVLYTIDATASVDVEAANKKDAKEKAWEEIYSPPLCHQCASDLDLGDPIRIIDVMRMDEPEPSRKSH